MPMASTLVALALALGAGAAAAAVVDSTGLQFVSPEAFCRFHCSPHHVAQAYRHLQQAPASECLEHRCGELARRLSDVQSYSFPMATGSGVGEVLASADAGVADQASLKGYNLNDGKNVETISFVSCQSMAGAVAARQGVSLTLGDASANAFAGFHDAFFQAYDAMVSSADATYDACKLQFVQDQLLDNYTAPSTASSKDDETKIKPMLVRLAKQDKEIQCLDKVRDIWTHEDESFTPFLTRSDQGNANATVLLLHMPKDSAERVADLDCIASVVQLPAVLKLTPFARASLTLARSGITTGGPSLDIRLVKGSSAAEVTARLQSQIKAAIGIENAITYNTQQVNTRGIVLQTLNDYKAWTKALAVILEDDAVEWVDLKTSISTGALAPGASFEQRLMEKGMFQGARNLRTDQGRRLDDYVQDLVGVTEVRAQNITGTDVVVAVTDTGLYLYHDQFYQDNLDIFSVTVPKARKVIRYQPFANNHDESEQTTCGHGTHVSGILAGSSYSGLYKDLGIAHSARIAFLDIGMQPASCANQPGCVPELATPLLVDELMSEQYKAGARIYSFSWGTSGNDYNSQARDIDDYVYNHPDVLVIVAAGNSGDKGAYSISAPSGAKNVISVGASLNDAASFVKTPCSSVLNKQTIASFSSYGPALDGRLKPDLVAPGMVIESAQSEAPGSTVKSSSLCSLQGTSQATPVVAGMAVLLLEWLRDGWWKHGVKDAAYGMKTIPAALLKALIIHSGEKLSRRLVAPRNGVTSCVAMESAALPLTSYPDFNQGYGKPTMANLVSFKDDVGAGVYFFPNSTEGSEPRVTEGQSAKFTFMLTDGANLRVTLVWTDPAGSVGGKMALQNDLDLSVRVPNTDQVFYPLSGNGTRDALNNVEMVEVSYSQIVKAMKAQDSSFDGSKGVTVEAVVYGYSVKSGARTGQPFALVASSSPSSVETTIASVGSDSSSFWQPWMTVGIIVGGTLMVLFLIAVVWRSKTRAQRNREGSPALRAIPPNRHPTANADTYHGGAVNGGELPPGPSRALHQPQQENCPNRAPSNSRQANLVHL